MKKRIIISLLLIFIITQNLFVTAFATFNNFEYVNENTNESLPEESIEETNETESSTVVSTNADEPTSSALSQVDTTEAKESITATEDTLTEGDLVSNIDETLSEENDINNTIDNDNNTHLEFSEINPDVDICSASSTGVTSTVTREDGVWFWPAASSTVYFSDYAGCLGDEYHSWQTPYGHNGVDFLNGTNAVYASRDGTFYCTNINYDYRGIYAVIEHPIENSNFSYYSVYQHLGADTVLVSNGKKVMAGQQIASSGGTGGIEPYDNHLHFAIIIAPKNMGYSIANYNNGNNLSNIESNGWIYGNTIPSGGGRIVPNPKSTNDPSWDRIPSSKLAGFTASKGSITYTFNASEAGGSTNAPEVTYNRLDFNLNGGVFEEDSTLYKGTAAAFSDSYIAGSSIICATEGKNITLTSYATAIAVDLTGKVVDALQWQNNGTLTVPEDGFVIAVAQSSENTTLYNNIWNAAYSFNNGNNRYVWYDTSTKKVYVSSRYVDYGAYTGHQYTAGTTTGISERIPVKEGYLFCGWKTADGMVYSANTGILLTGEVTTITAQWYKKLTLNINGGSFVSDSSLLKGTVASVSNSFVPGSAIICTTYKQEISLTKHGSAIAVDMTGRVVDAIRYANTGSLTVPYGGFVIAVAAHYDIPLYDHIWNAAYEFENGNNKYIWYDTSSNKVYISSRYVDYGAYVGHQYTTGVSTGISERIPVKEGYLFCGWKTADGMIYSSNTSVALAGDITTVTAQWYKQLVLDTNGGNFEPDSTLLKGSVVSVSNSFVPGSAIICTTYKQDISLTNYGSAIAVDMTGRVVNAIRYANSGTITVPYGGFVIAVAAHYDIPLYDYIWNAAYEFENGNNKYIWYEASTKNVYISGRYIDYGAYTGNMYTTGIRIGITDEAPVKEGYVFGGWLAQDGTVYPGNCMVSLGNSDTSTITAIWTEE